jgi:hypothetical protein
VTFSILCLGAWQAFAEEYKPTYAVNAYSLNFTNGYMAYFEEIDDSMKRIDTSGYVSGVYDNSVPRKLLYEIKYDLSDLLNPKHHIFSSTGTHHVEFYSLADFEAIYHLIRFYELGKVKKEINIMDYIEDKEALELQFWGLQWYEYFNHDYINDILHIETMDGQYISFNIFTGEMIYRSDKSPFDEIAVGSTVIVSAGLYYGRKVSDWVVHYDRVPIWVRCTPHVVSRIEGDRVLLGAENGINSWVSKNGVIKYVDDTIFNR